MIGVKGSRVLKSLNYIYIYLFFIYFSVIFQLLLKYSHASDIVGLRDALIFTITLTLIPVVFPRVTKYYLILLGVALWICSLVSILYYFVFKQEISQSIFFIIFETNNAESTEFIGHYFQWWMLLVIIVYAAVPIWLYKKIQIINYNKKFIYGLFIVCCAINLSPYQKKWSGFNADSYTQGTNRLVAKYTAIPGMQFLLGYNQYRKEMAAVNTWINHARDVHDPVTVLDPTQKQVYVLVIGESTNRQRMGLYSYNRNTSPLLNSIKDQLLVFNNVITPKPTTIEALFRVLTLSKTKDPQFHPNLITLTKSAGFKTYWISNQQTISDNNSLLTAFSRISDETTYLNHGRRQSSTSYDEKIFEPFKKVLQSGDSDKKFIILHLLGTHGQYRFRYPKEFEVFTRNKNSYSKYAVLQDHYKDLYDEYDNAILYNDYIVYNLITILKENTDYSSLVYFSDHGEEVFDNKEFFGRNEQQPTPAMYTIPLIVWGTEQWKIDHSISQWHGYVDRAYSTLFMAHSLCDLMQLKSEYCDKTKSIFSSSFSKDKRYIGNAYISPGLKDYDEVFKS